MTEKVNEGTIYKGMRQLTRNWQGLKVQEEKGFTEGVRAAAEGEGHLKGTVVFESWEMPHLQTAHISDGLPRTTKVNCMRYTEEEGSQPTTIACPLHQHRKTASLTTL